MITGPAASTIARSITFSNSRTSPRQEYWINAVSASFEIPCITRPSFLAIFRTKCAAKPGKGLTPGYVGKATKSFRQEAFAHHKLTRYHQFLVEYKRGTP